jgi:hypothetical protein
MDLMIDAKKMGFSGDVPFCHEIRFLNWQYP